MTLQERQNFINQKCAVIRATLLGRAETMPDSWGQFELHRAIELASISGYHVKDARKFGKEVRDLSMDSTVNYWLMGASPGGSGVCPMVQPSRRPWRRRI